MIGWDILKYEALISKQYSINIKDSVPIKNVLRISTDKGYMCFKRVKYKKDIFIFILSAMEHLSKNGFESIIPIVLTNEGNPYIEIDEGFGYLTEWVQGRGSDFKNPIDLKLAAATLAKLHKASEGFNIAQKIEDRIYYGRWIEKFNKRILDMYKFKEIIRKKDDITLFDMIYLDSLEYYINQGNRAIEHIRKTKYKEISSREDIKGTFCHHDYANHNVIITSDLKVYIIDFDYCICDVRIHDVASLIIRNMRHGNYDMDKALFIIESYLSEGELFYDEIDIINAFMEFPQDFWQVGLQYYVEKQKWDEEEFNKRLNSVIKDKNERQDFLAAFSDNVKSNFKEDLYVNKSR